jgi:hypothetical protein
VQYAQAQGVNVEKTLYLLGGVSLIASVAFGVRIAVNRVGIARRLDNVAPDKPTHGNRLDSPDPNHVYVIVDTKTGELVKPGVSGQTLNRNGTSPRANRQLGDLNDTEPGRYKAVIVEQDVSRTEALRVEQLITDKYAARRQGALPTGSQRPLPQVKSREEFIDLYGFPDNR